MYSVKKMFLKISQNSKQNTCARVSILIKLQVRHAFFNEIETRPDLQLY